VPAPASSASVRTPRPSDRREFQQECVAFFAEVVQVFGVPRSLGQIYGVLYASPEPLSFSDIVERLDISKGSVSQGLQLLRSLGAINVVDAKPNLAGLKRRTDGTDGRSGASTATPGPAASDPPRRDYYEPELSLRKLVSGILRERVAPLAVAGGDRLRRLRALAEQAPAGNDFLLDRAVQLEKWRRRLKTVLPVLSVMLGPRSRS